MKSTTVNCKYCAAPMTIGKKREKYITCSYCGMEFMLEDEEVFQKTEPEQKEEYQEQKQAEVHIDEKQKADGVRSLSYRKDRNRLLLAAIIFFVLGSVAKSPLLFLVCIVLVARMMVGRNEDYAEVSPERENGRWIRCSEKNRWVAFGLCLFFGGIGVHHFYVGRIGKGILYVFTFGLFGIGILWDLVTLLLGRFRDSKGARLV